MGPLGHSISQCIVDFAHGKRCVIAKVAGDDWERSWPATEMTMLACTDQGGSSILPSCLGPPSFLHQHLASMPCY